MSENWNPSGSTFGAEPKSDFSPTPAPVPTPAPEKPTPAKKATPKAARKATPKAAKAGTGFSEAEVRELFAVGNRVRKQLKSDSESDLAALAMLRALTKAEDEDDITLALALHRDAGPFKVAEKVISDARDVGALNGFSEISAYGFDMIGKIEKASPEENLEFVRVLGVLVDHATDDGPTFTARKNSTSAELSKIFLDGLHALFLSEQLDEVEETLLDWA